MKTTGDQFTQMLLPFFRAMAGGITCEIELDLIGNRPARFEVSLVCAAADRDALGARLMDAQLFVAEWHKLFPVNEHVLRGPNVVAVNATTLETTISLLRREYVEG